MGYSEHILHYKNLLRGNMVLPQKRDRLNVSLMNGEKELILQLRHKIEKRTGSVVTLAEVVRTALQTQNKYENGELIFNSPPW